MLLHLTGCVCTRADERQGEKEQVEESLNTRIWVRSDRMSNLARFCLFCLIVGMGWGGMGWDGIAVGAVSYVDI
jgi:hypothetical protein